MPKYSVRINATTVYLLTVEAESDEQAEEIALNKEYAEMQEVDNTVEAFAVELEEKK